MILHLIATQVPAVQQQIADSVYNSIPSPKIVTSIPFLGSVVGSAILGTIKKFTPIFDSSASQVIKPFQPILVTAFGILIPVLAQAFHFTADPNALTTAFIAAPLGTILAITIREINAVISNKS